MYKLKFIAILLILFVNGCSFNETKTPNRTSPTNIPEISNNNRVQAMEQIIQENGGCKLPCVMGLTPRLSTNDDLDAFMSDFGKTVHKAEKQTGDVDISIFNENGWGSVNLVFFKNNLNVTVDVSYLSNEQELKQAKFTAQAIQLLDDGNAVKVYGASYYDEILKSFTLSNILETYGEPNQIYIRPYPDHQGYPSPPAQYTFDFVLFYEKQGFLVEYISVRDEKGNYFVGCPSKSYVTQISTWDTKKPMSLNQSVTFLSNLDGISKNNVNFYKQIQAVTSQTVSDFYKTFSEPHTNECVQTQKDLWPRFVE